MTPKRIISTQTRDNWLIGAGMFTSGLIAALTGIYFLFAPERGYQGGRNPMYGFTFLFSHETWNDIHTWSSVIMVAIAIIHIPLHWQWIVSMSKKLYKRVRGNNMRMSNRSKFNLAVNTLLGLSFLVSAISGLYFFLFPGSVHNTAWLLITKTTWKDIHTWSGVTMIIAALAHFWIHWKWITKVTKRIFTTSSKPQSRVIKAHSGSTVSKTLNVTD